MTTLSRTRREILAALAAAVLFRPISATAQQPSAPGLDISLEDGRLSLNVRDASLLQVLRAIAAKGGFALDIAGPLDSKVTASFENLPLERGLRRIVGRSSYVIELAPATDADQPRRIAKLSIFARSAPKRIETSRTPRGKRRKATTTKRSRRRGGSARPGSRRRARPPGS